MTQPITDAAMDAKEERVAEGLPVSRPPKTVEVGKVGNIVEQEPVAAAFLISAVVFLGAKYGFRVDMDTAAYTAGGVMAVLSFIARQMAVPLARAKAGMDSSFKSNPATDARPVL